MSPGVAIVGAGLAAQRCAEALRHGGYDGTLRLVGDEPHRPYDRPPLSKEALAQGPEPEALALRPAPWYAANGVELLLGRRAVRLAHRERRVVLDGGDELRYERLVIATGGRPRTLPGLGVGPRVHALRTLEDARRLRPALAPGARLAIVGAGFVGLEVAATARRAGATVTVIEAAPAPLAAVLGVRAGALLARMHAEEGVDLRLGRTVAAVLGGERVAALRLDDGAVVACDAVLVATGVAPALEWLRESPLHGARGIAVDAQGRTALPDVLAAGDCTGGGHWEAAARQGAAAARAILGLPELPAAPPSFWSDQYGVRLQLVGRAAGHDRSTVDGDPGSRDFRVLFFRGATLIGGLLAGRPHELPALRRGLAAAAAGEPPRQEAA